MMPNSWGEFVTNGQYSAVLGDKWHSFSETLLSPFAVGTGDRPHLRALRRSLNVLEQFMRLSRGEDEK
jgi:hypothetical protein